jgi:antirestriction protein ArdC
MSSKTTSARPGHDRASLYDEITGKIIAELEAGRVPWVQPWETAAAKAPLAMPKNAATGRQYSRINRTAASSSRWSPRKPALDGRSLAWAGFELTESRY